MSEVETFEHAKQLMHQGNLLDALSEVEQLEQRFGITDSEQIQCQLLRINILIKLGKIKRSLTLANNVLHKSETLGNQLQIIDAIIGQVEAYWRLHLYRKSVALIERGEQLLARMKNVKPQQLKERKASLTYHRSVNSFLMGDLDHAMTKAKQSLTIAKRLDAKYLIAESINQIGEIFQKKGDLLQALQLFRESFIFFEELADKRGMGISLGNIGSIYQIKGELDLALEYKTNSVKMLEEIGAKQDYAKGLQGVGEIYASKGEIHRAFDYTQRSLVLFEEIGARRSIAENLFIIGDILRTKGDLNGALSFYHKCQAMLNEIGMDSFLPLARIGEIYHAKEEYDTAFEYFEESLTYLDKTGSDLLERKTLYYNLIKLCVDTNSPDKAEQYIQYLKQINEKEDNKIIDQLYRLAQAMLLKTSNRVVKIAQAQKIFRQVAEEEIVFFEVTVDAILNLCDLLLQELSTSGNEEILNELNMWFSRLFDLGQSQYSYSLLAEIYLLQSKLAILELDMEKAQELLSKAQKIAEEKDLQQLLTKVSDEQVIVLEQLSRWDIFGDKKPSMSERIKLAQLEDLLNRLLYKKLYGAGEEITDYAERAQELIKEWEQDEKE